MSSNGLAIILIYFTARLKPLIGARQLFIRNHGEDGEDFKWDYALNPVTVVALLNFKFEHDDCWPDERYHSSYRLREDCTGEVMTDVLRYVFLELGRFRKHIWEVESTFDKWMYLLKHIHELDSIPEKFDTPEFRRLFLLAEIGNFTPEEMEHYMKSLKDMSDYYNVIDTAVELAEKRGLEKGREEGLEQGIEQGLERGRTEAILETARKLKELGVDIPTIAQATGLPSEEI